MKNDGINHVERGQRHEAYICTSVVNGAEPGTDPGPNEKPCQTEHGTGGSRRGKQASPSSPIQQGRSTTAASRHNSPKAGSPVYQVSRDLTQKPSREDLEAWRADHAGLCLQPDQLQGLRADKDSWGPGPQSSIREVMAAASAAHESPKRAYEEEATAVIAGLCKPQNCSADVPPNAVEGFSRLRPAAEPGITEREHCPKRTDAGPLSLVLRPAPSIGLTEEPEVNAGKEEDSFSSLWASRDSGPKPAKLSFRATLETLTRRLEDISGMLFVPHPATMSLCFTEDQDSTMETGPDALADHVLLSLVLLSLGALDWPSYLLSDGPPPKEEFWANISLCDSFKTVPEVHSDDPVEDCSDPSVASPTAYRKSTTSIWDGSASTRRYLVEVMGGAKPSRELPGYPGDLDLATETCLRDVIEACCDGRITGSIGRITDSLGSTGEWTKSCLLDDIEDVVSHWAAWLLVQALSHCKGPYLDSLSRHVEEGAGQRPHPWLSGKFLGSPSNVAGTSLVTISGKTMNSTVFDNGSGKMVSYSIDLVSRPGIRPDSKGPRPRGCRWCLRASSSEPSEKSPPMVTWCSSLIDLNVLESLLNLS